jgi:hypothetical protein
LTRILKKLKEKINITLSGPYEWKRKEFLSLEQGCETAKIL